VRRALGFRSRCPWGEQLGCQRCVTIPRVWLVCMTCALATQKRPVRDLLPKGSRSEEELLREQEEFFQRTTGGEVKPAATLVVRKAAQPVAAPLVSGASKPKSKFALERQRKALASAAHLAGSGDGTSSGAADTSGHAGGAIDAGQSRPGQFDGAQTAPADGESKKRAPPPKPVGEPMSVVNMTIVEKTPTSVAPMAPRVRSTPAPVAQHRSHRSAAAGAAALPWKGHGREGGRVLQADAPPTPASADDDEDWVDVGRGDVSGTRGACPSPHTGRGNAVGRHGTGEQAPLAGLGVEKHGQGGAAEGGAARKTQPGKAGQGEVVGGNAALPSKAEIDQENMQLLGQMSKADIEAMRKEVEAQLDPALLQKMRLRLAKSKQVPLWLLRPACARIGPGETAGGSAVALWHVPSMTCCVTAGRRGRRRPGDWCRCRCGGHTRIEQDARRRRDGAGARAALRPQGARVVWGRRELRARGARHGLHPSRHRPGAPCRRHLIQSPAPQRG